MFRCFCDMSLFWFGLVDGLFILFIVCAALCMYVCMFFSPVAANT